MGFPTQSILSQINGYLTPNVIVGTPLSYDFAPLGVYGASVVLDCDPVAGPVCLVEFDFDTNGHLSSVESS